MEIIQLQNKLNALRNSRKQHLYLCPLPILLLVLGILTKASFVLLCSFVFLSGCIIYFLYLSNKIQKLEGKLNKEKEDIAQKEHLIKNLLCEDCGINIFDDGRDFWFWPKRNRRKIEALDKGIKQTPLCKDCYQKREKESFRVSNSED